MEVIDLSFDIIQPGVNISSPINMENESFALEYLIGDLVFIKPRSGPNLNVEGGMGRIDCIHDDGKLDVSLILGGKRRNIPREWVIRQDSICNDFEARELEPGVKTRIPSARKRKRLLNEDISDAMEDLRAPRSEIYKLAIRISKLDKSGFLDEPTTDDSSIIPMNHCLGPESMGAFLLRANTDYYKLSDSSINWDLFMSDVTYLCNSVPTEGFTDKDLKLFSATTEKILSAVSDACLKIKLKDKSNVESKATMETLFSYQSRNGQPAVCSNLPITAYPLRRYQNLSGYQASYCMTPNDQTLIHNELETQLDGFIGQAYNYDDAELSEGWMCSLLEATFKENTTKARNVKTQSMLLKAHVRSILDGLVSQVVDNVRNNDSVLLKSQCCLGVDCEERAVWGFDCYSRRNIEIAIQDRYPNLLNSVELIRDFVEIVLPIAINRQQTDMAHDIRLALREIMEQYIDSITLYSDFATCVLSAIETISLDHFRLLPKGTGVICTVHDGIPSNSFVTEYLGDIFPSWRWCEKQDGIEAAQKKFKMKPALPDFYNMLLERPRLDSRGYGLVYIDASRCANFGSSCSHSCNSNCVTSVVAIGGKLTVALVTIRDVAYGEELTIDYNSVTTSEAEYQAAICLCGSMSCRGSFLRFGTQDGLQQIITKNYGPAFRFASLLTSSVAKSVPDELTRSLETHGIKESMLGCRNSSSVWMKHFVSKQVNFIEFERSALPHALLRPMHHGKRILMSRGLPDSQNSSKNTRKKVPTEEDRYDFLGADIDSRLVMEQRVQSLACCLSNVNKVLDSQPKKLQSYVPLSSMSDDEVICGVWSSDESIVASFINAINQYVQVSPDCEVVCKLKELHCKLFECYTSLKVKDVRQLRQSLLAIRDILFSYPARLGPFRIALSGHVLTLWAFTSTFVKINLLHVVDSAPVSVRARELGSAIKRIDTMSSEACEEAMIDPKELCAADDVVFTWKKSYKKDFAFWQLMQWYNNGQGTKEFDLFGCLCLPRLVDCIVPSNVDCEIDNSVDLYLKSLLPHLSNEKNRAHPFPDSVRKLFNLSGNVSAFVNGDNETDENSATARKRAKTVNSGRAASVPYYHRHTLVGSPILDSILGNDFNIVQVISSYTAHSSSSIAKKLLSKSEATDEVSDRVPPLPNCQWVMCCRCTKWRRLPWFVSLSTLPDDWYCEMNEWNASFANCDIPQDDYDPDVELTVDMSQAATLSTYAVGNSFDVYQPTLKKHYKGIIEEMGEAKALFSYPILGPSFDEWIPAGSTRIFPVGTRSACDISVTEEEEKTIRSLDAAKPSSRRIRIKPEKKIYKKSDSSSAPDKSRVIVEIT